MRLRRVLRFVQTFLPAFAAIALSGCNTAAPSNVAALQPAKSSIPYVTDPNFQLPDGPGCSGETARFQAIMDNDLSTGHVNKSVYDRAVAEIGTARNACTSGKDAQARAMIAATKKRYGYPG